MRHEVWPGRLMSEARLRSLHLWVLRCALLIKLLLEKKKIHCPLLFKLVLVWEKVLYAGVSDIVGRVGEAMRRKGREGLEKDSRKGARTSFAFLRREGGGRAEWKR